MQHLELEQEIQQIKERNRRVEADKAWETSWTRIISILIITYVVASIVMYVIGVEHVLYNALIPTLGFFLSVQSLPVIKRWWVNAYMR